MKKMKMTRKLLTWNSLLAVEVIQIGTVIAGDTLLL